MSIVSGGVVCDYKEVGGVRDLAQVGGGAAELLPNVARCPHRSLVQSSDGRADILGGSGGERWEADGEGVEKTTATAA